VYLVDYERRLANQNGNTNSTQSPFTFNPGAIEHFVYYWWYQINHLPVNENLWIMSEYLFLMWLCLRLITGHLSGERVLCRQSLSWNTRAMPRSSRSTDFLMRPERQRPWRGRNSTDRIRMGTQATRVHGATGCSCKPTTTVA
jgi:hypothetical protein